MDNEDIPYRAPVTAPTTDHSTDNDEQNYSTLEEVKTTFDKALEDLYKDFNAFDVLKEGTAETVKEDLIRQVAGRQIAYDILMPLQSTLESALQAVLDKQKGK